MSFPMTSVYVDQTDDSDENIILYDVTQSSEASRPRVTTAYTARTSPRSNWIHSPKPDTTHRQQRRCLQMQIAAE